MQRYICLLLVTLVFVQLARADDDAVPSEDDVCAKAIDLLSQGKQSDAEALIFTRVKEHPSKAIWFFSGVLVRSRFDRARADQIFKWIDDTYPNTLDGKVSSLIVAIDQGQDTEANFKMLDEIAAANSEDPLILWMVAVECRQLNKAQIGIQRYATLLKMLKPGPVLVHQTYGNLLMQVNRPDLALKQYNIAIDMEPASWDYNCRGNALMAMNEFDDATAAYKKAVELNPNDVLPWENWAKLCDLQHDPAGAAEKRAKVVEIRKAQQDQRRQATAPAN